MKRLTKRDEFGNADIIGVDSEELQCNLDFDEFNKVTNALNRLAEYEDLEEQCIQENSVGIRMMIKKFGEFIKGIQELEEYRELKSQGKLLKLPFKVGDKVYLVRYGEFPREYLIVDSIVYEIAIYEKDIYFKCTECRGFKLKSFGKTAFCTRQEAEEALLRITELMKDRD